MERPPQLPTAGFRVSRKAVTDAVRQLRHIKRYEIDPEEAHRTADAILYGLMPPEVRDAYDEIEEGFFYA